jgi:hypothetical protein
MPYTASGRKSTSTDHRLQMEKPMCSEKIEKKRLRRATFRPVSAQNRGSSGRQSSIHLPLPLDGGADGAATVFTGAAEVWELVGAAMATTVATGGYPDVALRVNVCSVSLTAADPLW